MAMAQFWHSLPLQKVFEKISSDERGLNNGEASRRIKEYGANKLPETRPDNFFIIFLRQFKSPLIYILLLASGAVFVIGEAVDSVIIFAVLLLNAVVGTIQEGKAQNTLLALKNFVTTKAIVVRDGKELIISDTEVVPGDIIILQEGEKVPADARIIISNNIKVDEAAMTGESKPAHKLEKTLPGTNIPIADQANMVFKGTNIVSGNGRAVVVATGLNTFIGKIARQMARIDTEIPLKANIRYLSRLIIATVAVISTVLFVLGLAFGKSPIEMFATIVSLAVSVVPEGLPIVVTLILASGVWRMSKRNALVKKLQAVEALGQVRVIAVDKTGTITKNELVITKTYVDGKTFEIEGVGYEPKGSVRFEEKIINPINHPELAIMGKIATYCADARVMFAKESKQWKIAGDPTEAAMLVFAQKIGFSKEELEADSPVAAQIPFDYKLKYRAVMQGKDKKELMLSGAPEAILELSKKIWHEGRSFALSRGKKDELESVFARMSRQGLRVIALAKTNDAPKNLEPKNIGNLTFVGFFGMKDTLRPEVAQAMQDAMSAAIKVIMITGDNKLTAESIAKEAGIYKSGDRILTGGEIDKLSEEELSARLANTTVFARVNPEHKLKIIRAYKARGEIVAMTGDGVNDALSLAAADLGVAMGTIGTEVAKEAADIVLLDDNFGSIIAAVEEGRSIYKTIKKVILYLFSTSFGEVFTIAGALFLGFALPILPVQIIWLNFITDGFLDISLAMEPKEKGLLRRNFERPKKYLIDKLMAKRMLIMAPIMAVGALLLFHGYMENGITKAWTMCLTVLAAFQWFNAWNCRSEDKSIFQLNPFSNKFLVAATLCIVSLQIFAVYNPFMQNLLRTAALNAYDWMLAISVAASIIVADEIRKCFYRRKLVKI